jgi:hypothetical protein
VSGKINKSFGDPSKSEIDKYLETMMADIGLLDINELSKKERKALIEASRPTYMMKKRKKKLAMLLKISQEDLYVYHAAPSGTRKSIKQHGILSSKEMLNKPELLKAMAERLGETADWVRDRIEKNLKDDYWARKESNPSVFFSEPDWGKLDDNHSLKKSKHDLYKINLSKLLSEIDGSSVWGLELEPYSGTGPYNEREISLEEVREFSERGPKGLWKDYTPVDNYYAVDVPHAFVMSGGYIPKEYIEYVGPLSENIKLKTAKRRQLELPFPELELSLPDELVSEPSDQTLVRNIPFEKITMSKKQGDSTLADLRMNRPSMTDGLPELFWDTEHNQLIVEDGNHRIFQAYLDGDRTFDAMVSSGDYNDLYRPVYDKEERFEWGPFPNENIIDDGRSYKIARLLKISKEMDAYNVRSNDIITVFHGTSLADCYEMVNGFDANNIKPRLYGGPKHAGIFVAPAEGDAEKFAHYGEIILEIDVRAKFLHGVDYSGNIGRASDPHAENIDWHEREISARNDFAKNEFPDSFRPTLSKTWTQKSEPQALLRGLVSPDQIKRVRYKEYNEDPAWYSREDFLSLDLEVIPRSDQPYGSKRKFVNLDYDLSSTSHSDNDFKNMMAKALDTSPEGASEMIDFYSQLRREHPERKDMLAEIFDKAGLGETASRTYSKRYAALKALSEMCKLAVPRDEADKEYLKKIAERKIFWHGTSSKNLRGILKEGLLPDKDPVYDDETGRGGAGRSIKTYGGVYLTDNFSSASAASSQATDRSESKLMIGITYETRSPDARVDEDEGLVPLEFVVGTSADGLWRRFDDGKLYEARSGWGFSGEYNPEKYFEIADAIVGFDHSKMIDKIVKHYIERHPRFEKRHKIQKKRFDEIFKNLIVAFANHLMEVEVERYSDDNLRRLNNNIESVIKRAEDGDEWAVENKEIVIKKYKDTINNINNHPFKGSWDRLRNVTDELSAAAPELNDAMEDSFRHNLRSMIPIGFSGKNRILVIVEDSGYPDYILTFHYGAENYKAYIAEHENTVGKTWMAVTSDGGVIDYSIRDGNEQPDGWKGKLGAGRFDKIAKLLKFALLVHGDGEIIVAYRGNVWLFKDSESDIPLDEDKIEEINNELEADLEWDTPDELVDAINEGSRPDVLTGRISNDGYKVLYLTNYSGLKIDPKSSPLVRKILNQLDIDTVEHPSGISDESFEVDSTHSTGDIQDILYHGTTAKYLSNILQKGLVSGISDTNFSDVKHDDFIFLTSLFDKAQFHATNSAIKAGGDPMIVEVRVPDKNQLIQDYDVDNQSEFTDLYGYIRHSVRENKYDTTKVPGAAMRLSKEFGVYGYRGRIPASYIESYHIVPNAEDNYTNDDIYGLESIEYEEVSPEQARVYAETKENYGMGSFDEPEFEEEDYEDEGMVDGNWGTSASGLFITDGSRVLLLKRSEWVQDPGLWGIPGGAIPINVFNEEKRDAKESAFNEAREEMGSVPSGEIIDESIFESDGFTYTTYIYEVSPEILDGFGPVLNSEHTDYKLQSIKDNNTSEIHPGVIQVINKIKKEASSIKSFYGIIK